VADCTAALAVGKYANAYYHRGRAYAMKKEHDKAMADFGEAIRLSPRWSAAYTERGGLYMTLQDGTKALADLDKAITLDPKDAPAYFSRGCCHKILSKDYDKAVADYTEAHKLFAGRGHREASAMPLRYRGAVHLLMKQYDAALADYAEAIRLAPNNGEGYLGRSKVYAAAGDAERARTDRVKAIQLNPDLAEDK
jgi:tetratricopeptide (TPR) repeat protein